MNCQNCGAEVLEHMKFCAKCGAKVEKPVLEAELPELDELPELQAEMPAREATPKVQPEAPVFETNALVDTELPELEELPELNNQPEMPAVEKRAPEFADALCAVWPEWKLEKQLGKGSYGVVYQAVRNDNNVESHAAIKVISIPSDASEIDSLRSEGLDMDGTRSYFRGIVDDFVGEIQLMESLKGIQNIVSVEDYKVVEKNDGIGWDIYIRMELLTPFNTYLLNKSMDEAEVIKLGNDICSALELCNQRNVIHRDIKPENIFVNDFGHFKLGDFGIARKLENTTGGLSQKGTFNYMAPEVANGGSYDGRVDTYSLGIVLYRLLNNNRLPFLDSEQQVLNPNERKKAMERRLHGEELPAPCNASPEMASFILKACAYNPDHRFASPSEMKAALAAIANGTYSAEADELDRTTAVRSAQDEYDGTVAVRKAPDFSEEQVVDTFGDTPKKKMSKGKKAKMILIGILAGIIALAIALVVLYFTSAAYGVYKDLDKGNYQGALESYHADVKDSAIQEAILDHVLDGRVDEVYKDYEDGELEYERAIEELNALKEMGYAEAEEKAQEITASKNAAVALEKADEYYENGDYENAINEYSKIPESDENYAEVQKKLAKVYVDYINQTVREAENYYASNEYEMAVQRINTAYDVLPDDIDTAALDTEKEKCLTAYKTEIANDVAELVADDSYPAAFDLIDEAISFDDNEYFQKLKTSTQEGYVKSVTAKVNAYLKAEDYISASRVADNSLTVLPGNVQLKELAEKVRKATPTYLLDECEPYSSNEYSEYINGETIQMGGVSFTNAFTLTDNGYAIFNIKGAYTKLSFSIGHVDGSSMTTNQVRIYCDGILKTEMVVEAEALPKKISLDVTGVNQLKFEVQDDWYSPHCGFANVTVK